jgi:hypothetical protein
MEPDDWYLRFHQSRPTVFDGFELKSVRILIEEYERALSAAAGAPVSTTAGPYSGNPRDFYSRELTLAASRGDQIRIELRIQQSAFSLDDPSPILGDSFIVVLRAPPASYAAKLAAWHALRDQLAEVGCVDRTVDSKPTSIVDEASAAGDLETATRLAEAIAEVQDAEREAERARRKRVEERRARDAERAARSPGPVPTPDPPPVSPVAKPVEPRVTFQGGVLEVAAGTVDAASLRALIEGGAYRDATKVVLAGTPIGDEGVAFLARSGGFPSVTELHLGATGITDRGARALAQEAVGLDHLERLDLGDVPAESSRIGARDDSGVSDAGVEALARSLRLPALRTIDRGKEWRFVPGGREGREVIEIRRADGRVVESRIYHLIWP